MVTVGVETHVGCGSRVKWQWVGMGRRTLCFQVHPNLAPNRTTLHIRQSIHFGSNRSRCTTKELELQDYMI